MKITRISLLMPTPSTKKKAKKILESVLNQQCQCVEVICEYSSSLIRTYYDFEKEGLGIMCLGPGETFDSAFMNIISVPCNQYLSCLKTDTFLSHNFCLNKIVRIVDRISPEIIIASKKEVTNESIPSNCIFFQKKIFSFTPNIEMLKRRKTIHIKTNFTSKA